MTLHRSGSSHDIYTPITAFLPNHITAPNQLAILNQERNIIEKYHPNDAKLLLPIVEAMLEQTSPDTSPLAYARLLIDKAKLFR